MFEISPHWLQCSYHVFPLFPSTAWKLDIVQLTPVITARFRAAGNPSVLIAAGRGGVQVAPLTRPPVAVTPLNGIQAALGAALEGVRVRGRALAG